MLPGLKTGDFRAESQGNRFRAWKEMPNRFRDFLRASVARWLIFSPQGLGDTEKQRPGWASRAIESFRPDGGDPSMNQYPATIPGPQLSGDAHPAHLVTGLRRARPAQQTDSLAISRINLNLAGGFTGRQYFAAIE